MLENLPDPPEQASSTTSLKSAVSDQAAQSEGPGKEFLDQFVQTQRRLYLFLLAQTANPHMAEEILQNTNVVILSKWRAYERGTNFLAWVYRIAGFEVLKYRQKNRRSRLLFDDDFLMTVTESVEQVNEQHAERRQALATCIGKLRAKDREILQLRYQQGGEGKTISDKLQRPVNSIYQSLGRIRRTLLECVERELALGNRS